MTFGAARTKKRAVLPIDIVPAIVGTGLNQFAMSEIMRLQNLGK